MPFHAYESFHSSLKSWKYRVKIILPPYWKSTCDVITVYHSVSGAEAGTKPWFRKSCLFLIASSQDHCGTDAQTHGPLSKCEQLSLATQNTAFWRCLNIESGSCNHGKRCPFVLPLSQVLQSMLSFLKPILSGETKSAEPNEAWPAFALGEPAPNPDWIPLWRNSGRQGRHAECWREKTVWQSGDILLISNLTIRKCQRLYPKA